MAVLYSLFAGFVLDLLLGDPRWMPHPVVAIGRGIALSERTLRRIFPKTPRGEIAAGAVLVVLMLALSFWIPWGLLRLAAHLHPDAAMILECFMCYQILATKCLRDSAMEVYRPLARGDLAAAREAVGRIVGRDTAALDAGGVTRAAVETVAENASDGVVAPMLFFAVGGAPLAFLYKAVNTMDSMVGYKNERYLYFGRVAARVDDVANWFPARLTALFLIAAAFLRRLDWRGALRVYRRDRNNHSSPNSGHPESAVAGALGIRLGGDSSYGGAVVRKLSIGDASRDIEPDDIRRTCGLLYVAAVLCLVLCCSGRYAYTVWANGAALWI